MRITLGRTTLLSFVGVIVLLGTIGQMSGLALAAPSSDTAHVGGAAKVGQAQQEDGDPRSLALNEQGVQAAKAKDYAKAEELFKRAIAVDAKNLTAVFNLASMYLTNKEESSAISLLETYTDKVQNDAGLYARLGDAYFASKNPQRALAVYEKGLAINQSYPGLLERLGTVYVLQNRYADAERVMLLAVEQKPRDAQLLANLSSIFLKNKKPQDSVSTAKRALQVKPTTEVYITMGNAYENLGDFGNALISFQRAKDLGDKRPELEKKIAALTKRNASDGEKNDKNSEVIS